ncbi:MAG: hypothetical protein P8Y45_11555 [Exilibacterium sp.]
MTYGTEITSQECKNRACRLKVSACHFWTTGKANKQIFPKKGINFFRFFARLLQKHYTNIQYYEVHGNPGHVRFNSGLWPSKPPVTKGLGDLIIITYSYWTKEARYTIQQNKFHKTMELLLSSSCSTEAALAHLFVKVVRKGQSMAGKVTPMTLANQR